MSHDTWRDSARLEVIGDGTHKINIITTDDSCRFRLKNTMNITSSMYCVIPFLSETSNLILSLPLSQTHSDLRSAESIPDYRPYVSFTGFAVYIAVRCGFTTVR